MLAECWTSRRPRSRLIVRGRARSPTRFIVGSSRSPPIARVLFYLVAMNAANAVLVTNVVNTERTVGAIDSAWGIEDTDTDRVNFDSARETNDFDTFFGVDDSDVAKGVNGALRVIHAVDVGNPDDDADGGVDHSVHADGDDESSATSPPVTRSLSFPGEGSRLNAFRLAETSVGSNGSTEGEAIDASTAIEAIDASTAVEAIDSSATGEGTLGSSAESASDASAVCATKITIATDWNGASIETSTDSAIRAALGTEDKIEGKTNEETERESSSRRRLKKQRQTRPKQQPRSSSGLLMMFGPTLPKKFRRMLDAPKAEGEIASRQRRQSMAVMTPGSALNPYYFYLPRYSMARYPSFRRPSGGGSSSSSYPSGYLAGIRYNRPTAFRPGNRAGWWTRGIDFANSAKSQPIMPEYPGYPSTQISDDYEDEGEPPPSAEDQQPDALEPQSPGGPTGMGESTSRPAEEPPTQTSAGPIQGSGSARPAASRPQQQPRPPRRRLPQFWQPPQGQVAFPDRPQLQQRPTGARPQSTPPQPNGRPTSAQRLPTQLPHAWSNQRPSNWGRQPSGWSPRPGNLGQQQTGNWGLQQANRRPQPAPQPGRQSPGWSLTTSNGGQLASTNRPLQASSGGQLGPRPRQPSQRPSSRRPSRRQRQPWVQRRQPYLTQQQGQGWRWR